MMDKKILNVKETAQYLSVSRAYVYLLTRFGVLKPIRKNPILFSIDELNEYKKRKGVSNGTTKQEGT